jgi:hypothetical protein
VAARREALERRSVPRQHRIRALERVDGLLGSLDSKQYAVAEEVICEAVVDVGDGALDRQGFMEQREPVDLLAFG